MKCSILIVEDLFIEANNLRLILDRAGYAVLPIASDFTEAMEMLERHAPDLVLLDIYLRGSLTGIDLAKILALRKIPFIYLSANSNKKVFQAAKATKPYGFLIKPFRQRDVLAALEVAMELHGSAAAAVPTGPSEPHGIVTAGKSMQSVMEHIRLVGPSETSVLVMGESGTGKELVAKAIHETSLRRSRPFVVVNCGALPPTLIESELFGHVKGAFTGALEKRTGKFEEANSGTIFLDEIGELPPELQVKFLRVLQQKEIQPIGGVVKTVDVRVIAATNRMLELEVAAGRFRMDLYYRLNVFPIVIPPLRERREDIVLLAEVFLKRFAAFEKKVFTGFAPVVIAAMENYAWPGNVRELENVMRRTALLAKGPLVTEFYTQGASIPIAVPKVKSMADNERDHIISTLKACNGKVYGPGGAARLLGMNVSTLNSRIKKLGIEKVKAKP